LFNKYDSVNELKIIIFKASAGLGFPLEPVRFSYLPVTLQQYHIFTGIITDRLMKGTG
jgi:hypothetical protein